MRAPVALDERVRNRRWWLNAYTQWRWWAGVFAVWSIFGVLMAAFVQTRYGGAGTFGRRLLSILPFYWVWVPMMPFLIEVVARFDFQAGRRIRSLAVHVVAGLAAILVHGFLYSAYRTMLPLGEPGGFIAVVRRIVLRHAPGDLTTYAVVAGAVLALCLDRRAQDREREAARNALRASRLETQLSAARLEALQRQLQPHFLFNALNTISVLVLKGADTGAIRAIRQLADLLRATLRGTESPERTLQEEIAFVEQYLAIEKLRFGDQLAVDVEVSDAAGDALVPNLILQPLIENAIVHGLRSSTRGGHIRLVASREDATLRLEVSDDGAGMSVNGGDASGGVGLANTRARLEELYGDGAGLTMTPAEGGGTIAAIRLPFHTQVDHVPDTEEREPA